MDADDVEGAEADLEGGDLAPHSQVILTGCWLTMKEISLLLGIIATCAPLPGVCACVRLSLCLCMSVCEAPLLTPVQTPLLPSMLLLVLTPPAPDAAPQ